MYYIGNIPCAPSDIRHFGILGMKWGIRRFQNEDGSLTPAGEKRYRSLAQKDAKETARARMYYGEGAGTRRKLQNAKVNQRSKESKAYRDEYQKALKSQNMEKAAKSAQHERTIADGKKMLKKLPRTILTVAAAAAAVTAACGVGYDVVNGMSALDTKLFPNYSKVVRRISDLPNLAGAVQRHGLKSGVKMYRAGSAFKDLAAASNLKDTVKTAKRLGKIIF